MIGFVVLNGRQSTKRFRIQIAAWNLQSSNLTKSYNCFNSIVSVSRNFLGCNIRHMVTLISRGDKYPLFPQLVSRDPGLLSFHLHYSCPRKMIRYHTFIQSCRPEQNWLTPTWFSCPPKMAAVIFRCLPEKYSISRYQNIAIFLLILVIKKLPFFFSV